MQKPWCDLVSLVWPTVGKVSDAVFVSLAVGSLCPNALDIVNKSHSASRWWGTAGNHTSPPIFSLHPRSLAFWGYFLSSVRIMFSPQQSSPPLSWRRTSTHISRRCEGSRGFVLTWPNELSWTEWGFRVRSSCSKLARRELARRELQSGGAAI